MAPERRAFVKRALTVTRASRTARADFLRALRSPLHTDRRAW